MIFLTIHKYKMSKNETKTSPDLILILSGKRKSGKDYVFTKLTEYFNIRSDLLVFKQIVLSSQLKKTYAAEHNLNYEQLLDSSSYKENYRLDMIK